MNDWGDWDNLVDDTWEMLEENIKEEQQYAVKYFMEQVTRPAEYRGQQGHTPVDSGKLMANTVVSIGSPDYTSYDIEDEHGEDTYYKAILAASTAPAFSKIYIQNNAKDGNDKYSLNADYKGWKKTPAYRFFTLSWNSLEMEMEDRNGY